MKTVTRLVNGVRKIGAGLRPFNESVWPGVRNDLFVAHQSIYEFFARYASGRDVLDAGCGTGYGAQIVGQAARSVLGVDVDALSIRYARKHYAGTNVRFAVRDIERLAFYNEFDLVTASNSLEHLHRPERFLDGALRGLRAGGELIVAVPPIFSTADLDVHRGIRYHRSNLTVAQWHALLAGRALDVACFSHVARGSVRPDFSALTESDLSADDFTFNAVSIEELLGSPTITALFVASKSHARDE